MKLVIFVAIALAGFAASENTVPSFSWIPDSASEAGVPHLAIHFHDGQPDDIALLKYYNPIPKGANEDEDSIDKCIFVGTLLHESDVHVALTGGCPFEDSFDIQFRSKRLQNHLFKSRNGKVEVVPSIYQTKGLIFDVAKKPPANAVPNNIENPPPNPNGFGLNVRITYDASFAGRFGGDAVNAMRRVATQAIGMYTWPSLAQPLTWYYYEANPIGETIDASNAWLDHVGNYNDGNMNSNVYLCSQGDAAGVVGLAWVGTICGQTSYRTAVVEYFSNDLNSGEVLAHEVGHNCGMNHDFNGSPGNPRYSSGGQLCTNIGGVLDYYQPAVTTWTACSNDDFNGTPHSCLPGK